MESQETNYDLVQACLRDPFNLTQKSRSVDADEPVLAGDMPYVNDAI
jgi:hypothetical protein